MKIITLLLFLNLGFLNVFSQSKEDNIKYIEAAKSKENNSTIIIKLGAGIPQGDFADDDIYNNRAALAETGFMFELEYYQEFTESLYFSFIARFQSNKADPQPIADANKLSLSSEYSVAVSTDPWKTNSFMLGLGTISELNLKTNFITRFMIGYGSSASPEVRTSISHPVDGLVTITQSSENGNSISFLAGMGLQIEVNNQIGLLTSLDYYGSSPEFEDVNVFATGPGGTLSEVFNFEQQIRLLNLSFGLAIKLP